MSRATDANNPLFEDSARSRYRLKELAKKGLDVTAEVAIMNKHAIVLAADSATTVSMWINGERTNRYFKGANKLFHLSSLHPVGIMIYGSASLQGVPWEILIKDFRRTLGSDCCAKLRDYPAKFFDFIQSHLQLFPESARRKVFLDGASKAALLWLDAIGNMEEVKAASTEEQAVTLSKRFLTERIEGFRLREIPEPLTSEDIEAALAAYSTELQDLVVRGQEIAGDMDRAKQLASEAAELGIWSFMTDHAFYLDNTGVVVGGYGDDEFFPSFEVYECYGFLDRHFLVKRLPNSRAVGEKTSVAIEPFAMKSMINTFRMGIGPQVFERVGEATKNALARFAEALRQQLAPEKAIENLESLIEESAATCRDEWFGASVEDHYGPFARVVGSLPIVDMAALARSLIELESLKERVTDSSESVSGPIDVAAITKHDGFVWIDRKHYFRPELNPRFFIRQQGR